ncbi:MAG TPA: adenylate/guanylate cyclase domain-containing protein [Bacteroidota bacterium]|nr:adenylate/guanylate cyclase domain-containing protein [Bacteroidota bacterium]
MKFFPAFFGSSLRNRLLFLTIMLVVVVSGSVLFVLNIEIRNLTNSKLQQDFTNTYQTFKRFLALRNERLVESCTLISELPVLKAQLSTKDPTTIREYVLRSVESPAKVVDADIFTLTDDKGKVWFRLDHPEKFGDTIASVASVQKALAGKDPSPADISILVIDDKLYQTVTVPIFQQYLVGTLTLGRRLTQDEAALLKQDTQSDITFLHGSRLVASTHSEIGQVDLLRAYLVNRPTLEAEMAGGKSIQQEVKLNGEQFICAFSKASAGSDVIYVMAVSVDQAIAAVRKIESVVILVGLVALMIGIIGAFLLADGITAPLRRLVMATEAIRSGNYEFQVLGTSKSTDEIGMLARSFDEMVLGLKERFLMSKFVSASTVQMIRDEKGDVRLGGERRNVTVFFSDIRGFTAFSEHVEPEVVIDLLNRYLSKQAAIITKFSGVIDKYVGDEVIAIFEGEDMVDQAVLCAVEIQREIALLNKANTEDIRVGIGINTGMAIVGNVGGEERMDHTVLGNNMNLGARLCSIAQPGQIIISESSWRLLKTKSVRTKTLDVVSVKGMSRPMQTYEVSY